MKIQKQFSLKKLNTFGIDVTSALYAQVASIANLRTVLKPTPRVNRYILGGGSNILFTKNFDGLILQIAIKGKEVIEENDQSISVKLGAGENWHEFVTWAVENGYEGVENMALVPGTIGGAVVGNIAAYGQNLSEIFDSAVVYDCDTDEIRTMSNDECKLEYRSSIFKHNRNLVVLEAVFILRKQYDQLETSYHERKGRYGSLEEELQTKGNPPYTIKDVYDAVIRIRKKKLPNPEVEGTVGSIFVNPTVSRGKYLSLTQKISELQSYPVENLQYSRKDWQSVRENMVKIPAGRLLDELGWRGKWEGNVGVSEKHALCVVTNKQATGKEVKLFIEKMKKSVYQAYGIKLQSEVDIV